MQNEFQFFITKIIHGVGSSKKVGDIAKKLGARKALVMHGPNVKAAGIVDPCVEALKADGITCIIYDKVEIESPMHSIEEAAALGRAEGADICIAIGADGFRAAMGMMLKSVTDLHLSQLRPGAVLEALPLTRYDWAVLLFGTVVIFTASVIQERSQRTIREILDEKCLALRWAVLLAGIFAVVLMGVYGPGVQASEFVYMQF